MIWVHVCVCLFVCCVCVSVSVGLCVCLYLCVCVCVCLCAHACMCVHAQMKGVQKVDLGVLLQVTQALEAVLVPCFGPFGGQVLFTRDTGDVLITRDGQRILSSLRLDHPVAR